MTDQITYRHEHIDALTAEITRSAGELESTLADLQASLQPLVSTWTGSAASEYGALQEKWNRSSASLQSMLQRVAQAARNGNQDMQAADASAARLWG